MVYILLVDHIYAENNFFKILSSNRTQIIENPSSIGESVSNLSKRFNFDAMTNNISINDSLYAAIIGSLITIIPTWLIAKYNHLRNIDKEAKYIHFKDLKENVVSPLLYILNNKPDKMPSLKDV